MRRAEARFAAERARLTRNRFLPSMPTAAVAAAGAAGAERLPSARAQRQVLRPRRVGEEDRYSHTDLADFQANLSGSREAFETLKPALAAAGKQRLVHAVDAQFAQVQAGLDRYRRATPLGFALYDELTRQDRRQFAQQLAALTEPLSQVAGTLVRQ